MKRVISSVILGVVLVHIVSIVYFYILTSLQGYPKGPITWDSGQVISILALPFLLFPEQILLIYPASMIIVWLAWTVVRRLRGW